MGSYIIGSILDIFANCLSAIANPKSLYVYFKMAVNIFLHIGFYWNFAINNAIIQDTVEYAKI